MPAVFAVERFARKVRAIYDNDKKSDRVDAEQAQAVGLGALHAAVFAETEFLQVRLQEVPCGEAALLAAALRLGLVAAEENMAPGLRDAELVGDLPLRSAIGRGVRHSR